MLTETHLFFLGISQTHNLVKIKQSVVSLTKIKLGTFLTTKFKFNHYSAFWPKSPYFEYH